MSFSTLKSLNTIFLKTLSCTKYGMGIYRSHSTVSQFLWNKFPNNTFLRSVGYFNSRPGSIISTPAFRSTNISKISGSCCMHTKGDKELSDFLQEEVQAERNLQKSPGKIPTIPGFEIKLDEADVVLTKSFNNEKITVSFNVNHTVDADEQPEDVNIKGDKEPALNSMKSRPDFLVTIEKNGKSLAFNCAFVDDYVQDEQQPDSYVDMFNINDIYMYEKDSHDKTYSVSADIMDGDMYNLLMNILEERGISSEFAEQLVDFSSSYEHKLYINLLENLHSFISK